MSEMTAEEIQHAIESAVAQNAAAFAEQMAAMQAAHAEEIRNLNAGFVPVVESRPDHNVPRHGGGYGDHLAPTWSMAEQEQALSAWEHELAQRTVLED